MRQENLLGGSRYFLSDKWEHLLYTASLSQKLSWENYARSRGLEQEIERVVYAHRKSSPKSKAKLYGCLPRCSLKTFSWVFQFSYRCE
jgi:hypothetical protein